MAINAVALSTSLSRILLLGILIFQVNKQFNFKVKGIGLRAPIFSTLIMSVSLFLFNHFINMNIWMGILEIIIGVGIYFTVLILMKGLTKEDFKLIKSLIR